MSDHLSILINKMKETRQGFIDGDYCHTAAFIGSKQCLKGTKDDFR